MQSRIEQEAVQKLYELKKRQYGRYCSLATSRFMNVLAADIITADEPKKDEDWPSDEISRLVEKIYRYGYMKGTKKQDREDTLKDIYGLLLRLEENEQIWIVDKTERDIKIKDYIRKRLQIMSRQKDADFIIDIFNHIIDAWQL